MWTIPRPRAIWHEMIDDEDWLTLADSFQAAAVDDDGWYDALAGLAKATGSRHGQLVCMAKGADPLNLLTDVDPALPRAFVASGGMDPRVNPRRRAGLAQPPLVAIAEEDFITHEEIQRDPHYQEFAIPWDVPYICLTTLERRADMLVGLSVIRSASQGHIDAPAKRLFTSLAPHVRAAVRTSLALGEHRAALLTDTFERLAIAALVCDATGKVLRLTPGAEALLEAGRGLVLRRGRIGAKSAADQKALEAALLAAAQRRAGAPPVTAVVHSAPSSGARTVFDVMPLPHGRLDVRFDAHLLLVARGPAGDTSRRAAILQGSFGMTAAETEIALALLQGTSPAGIAHARKVSVGTVRVQIKSLLAKAGVSRQVELLARLSEI